MRKRRDIHHRWRRATAYLRERRRLAAFAAAVLLHLAVLGALLRTEPAGFDDADGPVVYLTLSEGAAAGGGPAAAAPPRRSQPSEAAQTASASPSPPPEAASLPEPPPPQPLPEPAVAGAGPPPSDPAEPSFADAAAAMVAEGPSLTSDPLADGQAVAMGSGLAELMPGASGPDCALEAKLGAALQADAGLTSALQRLPREARSVANAVMVWDGEWVADGPATGGALAEVRERLSALVEAASGACRAQVVRGPVFIPINVGGEAVVLTVGSGVWRWGQLTTHHVR